MRPLTNVAPTVLASILKAAPLSPGKVECAWRASVGVALRRATDVRLVDGVLLVDASSAEWAREVRRSSGIILKRLRALLGDDTVRRLTVRTR
jgi:predicted nucleic acid-binding Zn ribbon protein